MLIERGVAREEPRAMLRAVQCRVSAHSFPDSDRNCVHIQQPHLIANRAVLAIDTALAKSRV
jgi:hypothetical protein